MPPPSTQLFAEHLHTEWIQHFLTLSAHATVRRLNLSVDGEAGMNLLAPAALSPRRVSAWVPPRWNGSSARPHRHGARNVT
ncbi:hypothetical protein PU31_20310 [Escherichia coli]|nr:hypothetical protein PU31_20310 [Escherichia coli]